MTAEYLTNHFEARMTHMIGKAREDENYGEVMQAIRGISASLHMIPGVPKFGVAPEFHDGRLSGVKVTLRLSW